MISNFEKRLASLEKDHPCESDGELLALIDKLIDEEMAKGEAADADLISEAVSFALTLKGVDMDGAGTCADEAIAYVKRRSTRRTVVFAPRKAMVLIAAVMAIAVLSVGVYALIKKHFDMESITKDEFESIEKNQTHTEENMDYYISDKVAVYDTLDELMLDGKADSLLYPEGYECDGITVSELEGYNELRFIFGEMQLAVETPATRELYLPDRSMGAYKVSVIELETGYQCEFIHNGCIYTVISKTYDEAETFILSMTEREAK